MSSLFNKLALRFADWRSRQRALAELNALDDRSLADIGLSRSEIPYVFDRVGDERLVPATPRPANANYQHAA